MKLEFLTVNAIIFYPNVCITVAAFSIFYMVYKHVRRLDTELFFIVSLASLANKTTIRFSSFQSLRAIYIL